MKCIRCGEKMQDNEMTCARCGFTFEASRRYSFAFLLTNKEKQGMNSVFENAAEADTKGRSNNLHAEETEELEREINEFTRNLTEAELDEIFGNEDTRKRSPYGLKKGDIVEFGVYPQESEQPTPIKWVVLQVKDGNALLLSRDIIACKKYNRWQMNVTWENCSLRKWLNSKFIKEAFSYKELRKIVRCHNENNNNPRTGTRGGSPTDDLVFCLSIDEANKVRDTMDLYILKAKATEFAKKKKKCPGSWWLRSPGSIGGWASYVDFLGGIQPGGTPVSEKHHNIFRGVRPALWMRL